VTVYQQRVDEFRKAFLCEALLAHGGNRTRTAKTLRIQRTYLLRLIKDFQIDVPPPIKRHNNDNGSDS